MMSKIKFLLFALLSGGLFALAWPAIGGIVYAIFFAFLPLLWMERQISMDDNRSALKVLLYAYLAFLLFNLLTTWWIYYASNWGSVMAIMCNAFFMTVVFWLFHLSKKHLGKKAGYASLIIYWLAFEYIHLNWELSWPWLNLGNVFADDVYMIQWYEYTGTLGGTLFVLVINLLLFQAITNFNVNRRKMLGAITAIFLSLLAATTIGGAKETNDTNEHLNVVIIQPNIDPYYDKFQGISESDQIDLMIRLAKSAITEKTDVVVLPETAFPQPFWDHELEFMYGTEEFRKIINEYEDLRVIAGILCSKMYTEESELSSTARKLPEFGWYDNYNAAMHIDQSKEIQLHRKSKLVLGAEKVPFLKHIPWMKKLSVNLGGTQSMYGVQEYPSVFFNQDNEEGLAPIICYESVYGEYVNQYAQEGAAVYAIITNDGWWDNTPGYKQHLAYARLRAIEGRRSVIRSANTGISAIINSEGQITASTDWWEESTLSAEVNMNTASTFYIDHGDYIGRTAAFLAPLLLLYAFVRRTKQQRKKLTKH